MVSRNQGYSSACHKNATIKDHPKNNLRDENQLYGIVLLNLIQNKPFRWLDIQFFKKNHHVEICSASP